MLPANNPTQQWAVIWLVVGSHTSKPTHLKQASLQRCPISKAINAVAVHAVTVAAKLYRQSAVQFIAQRETRVDLIPVPAIFSGS